MTWALVPAKSFARAKRRLGGVLTREQRAALAQALLEHVLGVLEGVAAVERIAVVTDAAEVAHVAARRGALTLFDRAAGPLGRVVDAALGELAARGARRALIVMADLPGLARAEVERLLALGDEADVVLAPDAWEEGTNAIVTRLPSAWPSALGGRGSFARHAAQAREAGLTAAVLRAPGLARHLDEVADLRGWRYPDQADRGSKTRRALVDHREAALEREADARDRTLVEETSD